MEMVDEQNFRREEILRKYMANIVWME